MVTLANSPRLILALVMLAFGSSPVLAKRAGPKDVRPVIADGIRYSAPPRDGGGYVEATDVRTGKLLWQLRVYDIKVDPNLERDVQDIFITSLKVVDGKLQVMNEKGDKFVVDLEKRRVIQGANRVYRFGERRVNAPAMLTWIVVIGIFAVAFRRWRHRTAS
jgi:hypothetical protein